MAQLHPTASTPNRPVGRGPVPTMDEAATLPQAAAAPLTSSQQEILEMLEGRWSQADDARQSEHPSEGLGIDVVLAAVGAAGILSGMALLFFATALGAVVLVLGCLTCTLAFEHALIADTALESLKQVATAEDAEPLDAGLVASEQSVEH